MKFANLGRIRDRLRELIHIEKRSTASEAQELEMLLTITPYWENPIWYETDVQLALRDLTRRGDVLFDVGANIGGLSAPLSRLVGPLGKVIAFEASPRTIRTLNNNLLHTHCNNVYVEFVAVCDHDNLLLPFYYGHIPNADSLSDTTGSGSAAFVRTVTLDTYCHENSIEPNVIKMDIEGAEYLALKGFEQYISRKHPPLVLEVANTGSDAHAWLCDKGYSAINLSSYTSFQPDPDATGHSNALYIHPESERSWEYRNCKISLVGRHGMGALIKNANDDYVLPIGNLDPGRYLVEIKTTDAAKSELGQFEISVGVPQQLLNLHTAPMNILSVGRWQLPIHIDRPADAFIIMKRLSEEVLANCIDEIIIHFVQPGAQNWD